MKKKELLTFLNFNLILQSATMTLYEDEGYVQDMLITINAYFQGTAPTCIKELVKMRDNKYDLRGNNTLSLPKVNTTKYGLNSFRYFAAKQWNSIPNELRLRAGGLEFNKQVRNIQF